MTRYTKCFLAIIFLLVSLFVSLPVLADSTSKTSTAGITFTGDGSIEVSVTLQKQDKDTKALLSGAHFELRDDQGQLMTVKETLTTDSQGEIHLKHLHPGKYKFVETKSPKGYQLDTTPIPFEVDFDKTEATVIAYNQKQTSPQTPSNHTEQPKKHGFLPGTGMQDTTAYVFLGIVILIGVLYLLYRFSRHDKT